MKRKQDKLVCRARFFQRFFVDFASFVGKNGTVVKQQRTRQFFPYQKGISRGFVVVGGRGARDHYVFHGDFFVDVHF